MRIRDAGVRRRSITGALLVAVAVIVPAGCTFDPASIPVPGTGIGGETYPVRIEFASALNLPARARVVANGASIGTLSGVTVVDPSPGAPGHVVADIEVSRAVRLPATTTAELRQNTVLGDIYIALDTPPGGFDQTIPPGGSIPLSHTSPPLQVEDMLAGIGTFVGGGAVTQFQDIVDRVNAILPQDHRETARIADTLGADLTDVAAHVDQVSALGTTIQQTLDELEHHRDEVALLLTDQGARDVTNVADSLVRLLFGVAGGLGSIAHSLQWLQPLVTVAEPAVRAVMPLLFTDRPFDVSAPSNLNALAGLIRDRIIPWLERGPAVNIVSVTTDSAGAEPVSLDDRTTQAIAALRMIGVVR
ncbi:MlaD family protein [Nocardia sp. NPDC051030]|uniref:MlaD family protein n=1 Tax=Nocardia sp. NPDC051030 TaxID=3155162 RepID=UPI00342AB884